MPRTFFDQVLVATPRRRSRPWVTAGSVIAHVIALGVILVLPLTAAVELPTVRTPMPAMMIATTAPLPPEPAVTPPAAAPQLNPDAAPTEAPDRVTPEVERPPVPSVPPVPGGLPGAGASTGYTGLLGTGSATTPLSAPPPPKPQAPVRVGGVVDEPTRIAYTAPIYPQVAVAARIEGTVILEATIDAQGLVRNVTVLRSVPMLDRAAVDAVRQWRYQPTRLNGQPIPVIMTVTVTFSLK